MKNVEDKEKYALGIKMNLENTCGLHKLSQTLHIYMV